MDKPCFLKFVKNYKYRMIMDGSYSTKDKFAFFRKSFFFEKKISHSSTSKILALILLLPPVGSAITFSHTRHFIMVLVFPNIICSFLHLGHLIFMNLLLVSLVFSILVS